MDDPLASQFPLNVVELATADTSDDDDCLKNVAIQQEIEALTLKKKEIEAALRAKTQELQANIARNDERIKQRNMAEKWKEFEANWPNWDSLYFVGWLRRIKYEHYSFEHYASKVTKWSIDNYCDVHFGGKRFLGRFLRVFERDAIRQIGVEDEVDSLCVYQQILRIMSAAPLKRKESALKYVKSEDSMRRFLRKIGMGQHWAVLRSHGFETVHAMAVCIRHKGMEYVEKEVLAQRMRINAMSDRMRIVSALEQYVREEQEQEQQGKAQRNGSDV